MGILLDGDIHHVHSGGIFLHGDKRNSFLQISEVSLFLRQILDGVVQIGYGILILSQLNQGCAGAKVRVAGLWVLRNILLEKVERTPIIAFLIAVVGAVLEFRKLFLRKCHRRHQQTEDE